MITETFWKVEPGTRASAWPPEATIKYTSGISNDKTDEPVANVLVRANTDFNSGEGYTNAGGYVKIPKGWGGKFRNSVHYMVIWIDGDGKFKIHDSAGKAKSKKAEWIRKPWEWFIYGYNFDSFCATIYRAMHTYYFDPFAATAGLVKIPSVNVQEHWGEPHKNNKRTGGFNPNIGITNRIHVYGKSYGEPVSIEEAFATTFHELGHASHWYTNKKTFENTEKPLYETWAVGVEYAYTRNFNCDYYREHDNDYTGIAPSLMNQGITLDQLQTIMIKSGRTRLEQCRQPVKDLKIASDAIVDKIFNNPIDRFEVTFDELEIIDHAAVYPALNNPVSFSIPEKYAIDPDLIYTPIYDLIGVTFNGFAVDGGTYVRISTGLPNLLTVKFLEPVVYTIKAYFTVNDYPFTLTKQVDLRGYYPVLL